MKIKSYINLARINRPTGIVLLALPCFMGLFLVTKNSADFPFLYIALFALGSILMRSAGCVINDIFDRKFDSQVARTNSRPLANGELNLRQALILLAILLFLSLLILLQFNIPTQLSGLVALGLVASYPLMKRITFYPQIFLGIAFNYGILMADLAVNKNISQASCLLFIACIIWTLIYDTIYAFQDLEDDLKIGVKSSAIKFAKNPRIILASLAVLMFALIFFLGFLQKFSVAFYIISLIAFFYELFLILSCNYSDSRYCLRGFKANIRVGILLLLAIVMG